MPFPTMARSRMLLALFGALFMLCLTYVYIQDWRGFDLLNRPSWINGPFRESNHNHDGGSPDFADPLKGDLYLLGVGKADITGYVFDYDLEIMLLLALC